MSRILSVLLRVTLILGLLLAVLYAISTVLPGPFAGAVAGGLVSLATLLASKSFERVKEHETTIAEKRRDVYRRLLMPWGRMMANVRSKKDDLHDGVNFEDFYGSTFDAILYGSEEVVQRYVALRSPDGKLDAVGFLRALSSLLIAMREDVTKTKAQLSDEAVLRTFVNFKPAELEALRREQKNKG